MSCALSSGVMPAGFILDPVLLEIYGVGPASGSYQFSVQCFDNIGAPTTAQAYTLSGGNTGGSFIPLP